MALGVLESSMDSDGRRVRRLWRVAIVVALVTVSCRAETNVVVEIREDGSGIYTVELGLDDELQDLLSGFTGAGDSLIPGFNLDVPGLDGNPLESLESRVEGDMTFYSNTQFFSSPTELESLVSGAGEGNNFETFDIEIEGDTVTLLAQAGPPADLVDVDELPISLDVIQQAFSASLIVAMPGRVIERNADEVLPDGRLRWTISLSEGVDIEAVSDLSEPPFPWWIVGLALVALLAIGAGVYLSRRNAARPHEALEGTAVPPEPAGFERRIDVLMDPFETPGTTPD